MTNPNQNNSAKIFNTFAGAAAILVVAMASASVVSNPDTYQAEAAPSAPYVEVKTDQHPLARQAWDLCSSGKARRSGVVDIANVNGGMAQLNCHEGFWIFRGQKMPTDRPNFR